MTLRTNARVAGWTFLLYIVFGISSLIAVSYTHLTLPTIYSV